MRANYLALATWSGIVDADGKVDLAALKKILTEQGVNARGWRLYLDYGDALIEALGANWVHESRPAHSAANAADFLQLLGACEMDVPPPRTMVSSMAQWKISEGRLSRLSVTFFRAAWKAAAGAELVGESEFVTSTLVPVARWYCAEGYKTFDDARVKAGGWTRLVDGWREWWLVSALPGKTALGDEWSPIVRSVVYDGLRFVALTSAGALMQEGKQMSHCIGGYERICRESSVRAYSVRQSKTDKPVATIAVRNIGSGWEVTEFKGLRNAAVPDRYWHGANALLSSLDEVTQADERVANFLVGIRAMYPNGDAVTNDDLLL